MSKSAVRFSVIGVSLVALVVLALPAAAHVELEPGEVGVGVSTSLAFRIGHGCDGSPTTTVSIQIPAGVASVQPVPKPGWDLAVETGTLPEPVTAGDTTITDGVTMVTWSGGSLDDAFTDTFEIQASLYGDEETHVYFPMVQTCTEGEHAWIQIPEEGQDHDELESPAPGVELVAAVVDEHGEAVEGEEGHEADEAPSNNGLAIAALVVGGLGLLAGGTALVRGRSRS